MLNGTAVIVQTQQYLSTDFISGQLDRKAEYLSSIGFVILKKRVVSVLSDAQKSALAKFLSTSAGHRGHTLEHMLCGKKVSALACRHENQTEPKINKELLFTAFDVQNIIYRSGGDPDHEVGLRCWF